LLLSLVPFREIVAGVRIRTRPDQYRVTVPVTYALSLGGFPASGCAADLIQSRTNFTNINLVATGFRPWLKAEPAFFALFA
jgi:hypothetical protein